VSQKKNLNYKPMSHFKNKQPEDPLVTWLASNTESFEFYLLHRMLHDEAFRGSMLGVPLEPEDFRNDAHLLILAALAHAARVMVVTGASLPCPPTPASLAGYLKAASADKRLTAQEEAQAASVLFSMQSTSHKDQWYLTDAVFVLWHGDVKAKRMARRLLASPVADLGAAITAASGSVSAAVGAMQAGKDDMEDIFNSQDEVMLQRRSTGILGLDECLNGGWGPGECYLLFSGTSGGKSIVVGQCAGYEVTHGGYPCVVSTELKAREYVVRIVSALCLIPISDIQDCLNYKQIRMRVADRHPAKLENVDNLLQMIRDRLRIIKADPEGGINAGTLLMSAMETYVIKHGRRPTVMFLDWLGTLVDVAGAGRQDNAERTRMWEAAAKSCVKFSERTDIPLLVLAQAVNDSQTKRVLTINDIGIAKGIAKDMVAAIGATNTAEKPGSGDVSRLAYLDDQFFCMAKARKGENINIPVKRDFRHQRFIAQPRNRA